jgi:5-methylcytosine-specific restriction endonuclease McrA
MEYWQAGKLLDDNRFLARTTRMSLRMWRKHRSILEEYFEMPGWGHPYLDALRAKMEANYARRIASLPSHDPRRPDPDEWAVIRKRVFERDNYTCAYCGTRGGNLACDHIIPISRDGSNEDGNLTTACEPCNKSKGAMLLSEWLS